MSAMSESYGLGLLLETKPNGSLFVDKLAPEGPAARSTKVAALNPEPCTLHPVDLTSIMLTI